MRKDDENLFKWLWRKYNEFYDEAGFSKVGGWRQAQKDRQNSQEF